jgi:hypothetical protein
MLSPEPSRARPGLVCTSHTDATAVCPPCSTSSRSYSEVLLSFRLPGSALTLTAVGLLVSTSFCVLIWNEQHWAGERGPESGLCFGYYGPERGF